VERAGDVLRLFFIQLETRRLTLGAASDHGMDGADGPQCNRPGGRATVRSISLVRSRREVLRTLRYAAEGGRRNRTEATGEVSQSKCVRRTLGAISETGVPIETNHVWRSIAATSAEGIHCALSL
jgi:hypothetical protein